MDSRLTITGLSRILLDSARRLLRELHCQTQTVLGASRFYLSKFRGQHKSTLCRFRRSRFKQVAPDSIGQKGEEVAARFLKRRGLRVVKRSSRDRLGEIDLVAVDRRTIVFVEVKTRRSVLGGHPSEAVDQNKQRRLLRAASYFLKKHHLTEERCRFDVISVIWPKEAKQPKIEHEKDAFS